MLRTVAVEFAPSGATRAAPASLDDDADLAQALKDGVRQASMILVDRYGDHVRRVLANVLGPDSELPELLHDVFVRALGGVHGLKDNAKLKAWLSRIAVFVARERIRARMRDRRIFRNLPDSLDIPDNPACAEELREAVRRTYAVLSLLPADLRIAFALRYVHGFDLSEVAGACDVSLATIKRRLSRAEARFIRLARREPALQPWLEEGGRWSAR